MVWAVFGQTLGHEFVNFDDNTYVSENKDVELGLSQIGVVRAFTKSYVGIWLPVTMLSYQADYELFGMDPGAFHRTNVLFHTVTVIALFILLRSLTGSVWRSAFVAALFAIHPLRAESVAWISERKDVLSGFMFMLTLGAYTRYARTVNHCVLQKSAGRYLLVLLLFVLGLLSKPMLVTLPFILLLLDFWPQNRFGTVRAQRLILEKMPFFILSAVFCSISVLTQKDTISPEQEVDFLWRIGNAAVSYIVYIRQMIAPFGLAAHYPHPGTTLPLWKVSASILLLAAISVAVIFNWKKRPYLAFGWFWYLGMIFPVSGIQQYGPHAYADRYTYLPQIGLGVMLMWGIVELSARWRYRRILLAAVALVTLAGLCAQAWIQVSYWHDGETLWSHALAHTEDNVIANYKLAVSLERNGKTEQAIQQYQRALQVFPKDTDALINLGGILARRNQLESASALYRRALEIKPNFPEALTDLGIVFEKQGRVDAAIHHYIEALKAGPDYLEAHINIGIIMAKQGSLDAAAEYLQRAVQLCPDSAPAHFNLAVALAKQGQIEKAINHFQEARSADPNGALAERSLEMANILMRGSLSGRDD